MIIKKEKLFPYTPEKLWKAMTDAEALSSWLMLTDFKAELNYSFYFKSPDGVTITGEVLEIILLKKLVYSWKREGLPRPTTVTWSFLEMQDGTLLRLEHDGFDEVTLALFNAHIAGWDSKYAKLEKFLNT